MFNRTLQVDLVKAKKQQADSDQPDTTFDERGLFIAALVDSSIKKIGVAVAAYVVLDTIRQVVVKSMDVE